MNVKTSTKKYIDIFAGCGGLSYGLAKAGWQGLFAIEKDKHAFETLKHNLVDRLNHYAWPDWLPIKNHEINKTLKKHRTHLIGLRGTIDLVVGGPPCQGFSTAGRRKWNDKRNLLVNSYIDFISCVQPKALLLENVRGFTWDFGKNNPKGKAYSSYVIDRLKILGYKTYAQVIDFSDYGLPQRRKRFILIGVKTGDPKTFFKKLKGMKKTYLQKHGITKKVTVSGAISDLCHTNGVLPSSEYFGFKMGLYGILSSPYQTLMRSAGGLDMPDSHRFSNHRKMTTKRFKYIINNCIANKPINDMVRKKFALSKKVTIPLHDNGICPTLTTLPDDYIHYSEPRILTVREYARLQGFDDWYEFKGKYTTGGKHRKKEAPRYTQVGNAVSPLFSEQCGLVLKGLI